MSEMELNAGVLIPSYHSVEDLIEEFDAEDKYDLYDKLDDVGEPYKILNDKVYLVSWDQRAKTDISDICEVRANGDGTFRFLTYHYNGSDGNWCSVAEKMKEYENEI